MADDLPPETDGQNSADARVRLILAAVGLVVAVAVILYLLLPVMRG